MMKYGSKNEKAAKAWMEWRPVIAPLVALIGVGALPGMLKGLYEPYSPELVAGHIPLIMLFIGAVFGALSILVLGDLLSRRMSAFMAFRWRPGESYLAGKRDGQKKDEKRSEEKKR